MMCRLATMLAASAVTLLGVWAGANELPFQHRVEVYRSGDGDLAAFQVRLEQPFLAEEFEKSNYLRLRSSDSRAYLIYPRETRFQQKHAEFYGRLRGEGTVQLELSYETVSENLDGSRRVEVRQGLIEVTVPPPPTGNEPFGSKRIFLDWARQQNAFFAHMLEYYPEESFFQYCLLQSKARYGVDPPPLPARRRNGSALETQLYELFTGSLAIQESLQRETLRGGSSMGDYDTHISTISPPQLRSLDYEALLEEKRRQQITPVVHELAKLVPADQYFLHFRSLKALGEALDLSNQWGDSLLRLFTVQAQDNRLEEKLGDQLCLRRDGLDRLFADQVVTEVALTGGDPYLLEGTDLTMILRVAQAELFQKEANGWLADVRRRHPQVVSREFNYRGHRVMAHYTNDRVVSSFSVRHGDYFVYSNSHRAVRRTIDAALSEADSLHAALDYRYVTTLLPPAEEANTGYFFASEAFVKRMIGPEAKISQKRRLQCFNNLVMQNNASLLFRLEYGRSPASLSELIEGNFIDASKIVCPHGGAYAFDAESDTCTCSLHNRLKYLTPNLELPVLNVSKQEVAEYDRYKQRYEAFWQRVFDPIAVRITAGRQFRLETCVLPFANSSLYRDLRQWLDEQPQPLDTSTIAPSAVVSLMVAPGRANAANLLRSIPGVPEVVAEDPTLTDLAWLGDRVSLHYCDGDIIFEIDPTRLQPLDLPFLGRATMSQQGLIGALLMSANMPLYATLDVENPDKAARLLEQFSERIFLKEGTLFGLPTRLDAYRLPDYQDHRIYVLTARVYAATARLHIALVGNQLVFATQPEVLREVIDASRQAAPRVAMAGHLLLRINPRALQQLRDDVELNWAEKARAACHRNAISVSNFVQLYGVPAAQVPQLSEAKYGVRYYCPEGGEYSFDKARNQLVCSVHGNREHSRQRLGGGKESSFERLMDGIEDITAALRFEQGALIATLQIRRAGESR